jgi:large subunit ribosomal protein L21
VSYAVISVGGKQYLVREGERLLVDRLPQKEGATFRPRVLLASDDGQPAVQPEKIEVSARVVGHTLGEKIRIGKLKRRTGYRRHTGFRAHLSKIEIESIGAVPQTTATKAEAAATPAPARAPRRAKAAKPEGEQAVATEMPAARPAAAKASARRPAAEKAGREQAAVPGPARKPRARKEG